MSSQQHYQMLNLTNAATANEILSAYRRLSLKCHPDKGGDAAEFHKLTDAKDYCLAALELPRTTTFNTYYTYTANNSYYNNSYYNSNTTNNHYCAAPRAPAQKFKFQFGSSRDILSPPGLGYRFRRLFDKSLSCRIRSAVRKLKERRQQAKEQAAAEFERSEWEEAVRWTQMQDEARRNGFKC